MKKKTISDAVTNISAEYIEKAADYTVAKKSRKVSWYKWTAIAACLLLCLSIPFFTGLFDTNPPIIDNPSSQTTPNSDGNDGDFDALDFLDDIVCAQGCTGCIINIAAEEVTFKGGGYLH